MGLRLLLCDACGGVGRFSFSVSMLLVAACGSDPSGRAQTGSGGGGVEPIEIEQIEPGDSEVAEEWGRVVDQGDDSLGVDAIQWRYETEWQWQVIVGAMEFLREDPLESEVRSAIDRALRSVPGVRSVVEEDREVWAVDGTPSGEDLVRATAEAMAPFEDRIRAEVNG